MAQLFQGGLGLFVLGLELLYFHRHLVDLKVADGVLGPAHEPPLIELFVSCSDFLRQSKLLFFEGDHVRQLGGTFLQPVALLYVGQMLAVIFLPRIRQAFLGACELGLDGA
jgi:hypothetical protein